MPDTSKKIVITFKYNRSTKNTHRFHEDAPEGAGLINVLYVQRSTFDGGKAPEVLTVTIEH